jgi:hypothetical protein
MRICGVGKIGNRSAAWARRVSDFAHAGQLRCAPVPTLPIADEVIE